MSQRGSSKARDKWAKLVEAFEQGGESVSRFCRQHAVSPGSFYQWRRRLAKEKAASAFVPVVIEQPASIESDGVVRLCFPSQVCVEIPVGQTDLVCQAIHALSQSPGAES